MVGIQKLPKSDDLVLNISVKLIKSAYCSQFNMVYITVSDLLIRMYAALNLLGFKIPMQALI